MPLSVERLADDDWTTLRDLRLAALADSPAAFWATLEDESGYDETRWREFLGAVAWFVARRDGAIVGMIGGLTRAETAAEPEVISMWVRPQERGTGVADALVQALVGWARQAGSKALALWVVEGNTAAQRLYERNGFVLTGERGALPPGRDGIELRMRAAL